MFYGQYYNIWLLNYCFNNRVTHSVPYIHLYLEVMMQNLDDCFLSSLGGYPNNPGPNPAHPSGLSRHDCAVVDGFKDALCFSFRTDNSGPPGSVGVCEFYRYNYIYISKWDHYSSIESLCGATFNENSSLIKTAVLCKDKMIFTCFLFVNISQWIIACANVNELQHLEQWLNGSILSFIVFVILKTNIDYQYVI